MTNEKDNWKDKIHLWKGKISTFTGNVVINIVGTNLQMEDSLLAEELPTDTLLNIQAQLDEFKDSVELGDVLITPAGSLKVTLIVHLVLVDNKIFHEDLFYSTLLKALEEATNFSARTVAIGTIPQSYADVDVEGLRFICKAIEQYNNQNDSIHEYHIITLDNPENLRLFWERL